MNKSLVGLVSLAWLLGIVGAARSDDGKPNAAGQNDNPLKAVAVSLPGGEQGIGFDDIVYAPALHQVIVPAAQTGRVYLASRSSDTGDIAPNVRQAYGRAAEFEP